MARLIITIDVELDENRDNADINIDSSIEYFEMDDPNIASCMIISEGLTTLIASQEIFKRAAEIAPESLKVIRDARTEEDSAEG